MARSILAVCIDAVSPKGDSLAKATASSKSPTRYRQVMGPKSSVVEIAAVEAAFSIMVGAI